MLDLAVSNAAALRRLASPAPIDNATAFARELGKDPENFRKTLARLAKAGLISEEPFALTAAARDLLPRLDILEGRVDVPEDFIAALHGEIAPHPLNPRKTFDPVALGELKADIIAKGRLLQNLILRPADSAALANGVRFWIVGGERRWRAIGMAIAEGEWSADRKLPAQLRQMTDAEHLRVALAENLQRVDLDHVEQGETFKAQLLTGSETPQSIATLISKTPEYVQQHLRILRLPDDILAQMRAGEIAFHKGLEIERDSRKAAVVEQPALIDAPQVHEQVAALGQPGLAEPEALPVLDLPPKLALIVVELADKVDRQPAPGHLGDEGYTLIGDHGSGFADAQALVVKGVIGQRRTVEGQYAKVNLHTSGAKAWLTAQGFYDLGKRPKLITELRQKALGSLAAAKAHTSGRYSTDWLNPDPIERRAPPVNTAPVGLTPPECKPMASAPAAPEAQTGSTTFEEAGVVHRPSFSEALSELVEKYRPPEGPALTAMAERLTTGQPADSFAAQVRQVVAEEQEAAPVAEARFSFADRFVVNHIVLPLTANDRAEVVQANGDVLFALGDAMDEPDDLDVSRAMLLAETINHACGVEV